MKYFLSLGSNINAEKNLEFAVEELNKLLSNVESSSIHQTKAEGFEGDDFLNSVVCGNSELEFKDLNKKLKLIEDNAGRNRNAPKFSARTLDIDIVLQIDENDDILFAATPPAMITLDLFVNLTAFLIFSTRTSTTAF